MKSKFISLLVSPFAYSEIEIKGCFIMVVKKYEQWAVWTVSVFPFTFDGQQRAENDGGGGGSEARDGYYPSPNLNLVVIHSSKKRQFGFNFKLIIPKIECHIKPQNL